MRIAEGVQCCRDGELIIACDVHHWGPIRLEGLVFGVKREVANNICVPSNLIYVNRSNSSHVSSDFNSAFRHLHFVAKLDEVLWGSLIPLLQRDVR